MESDERLPAGIERVPGNETGGGVLVQLFLHARHSHQHVEAYELDEAAAWLALTLRQRGLDAENGHAAPSASGAGAADDPQATQQAVDRLHQYLTDSDVAAIDHVEANRELLRARFSREAFAELEQRINAFAFDEARAQLEEAMTSHAG